MNEASQYRYAPLKFFGLTVAFSWTCWIISAVLATKKENEGIAFLFNALGLFSPVIMGSVVVFTSGSRALKDDFKQRLFRVGGFGKWWAALLLIPPAIMALALGVSLPLGESAEQFRLADPIDQLLGLIIIAFILAPIIEELGWKGYGVDSLRASMGTFKTSIVFGVLWSAWHAPLVFIKGTYHYELLHMDSAVPVINFFVSVVAIGPFVVWLYYKCNRSIIAAVVAHSVINAAAILPDATQDTKAIVTVLYLLLTAVIMMKDREFFAEGPRNFLPKRA